MIMKHINKKNILLKEGIFAKQFPINEEEIIYNNSDIHNSIMYNYATMLQMYFNNIEDENEKIRIINKYNEIKYNTFGIDIFKELGCSNKTLYKSIKRQVLKCK